MTLIFVVLTQWERFKASGNICCLAKWDEKQAKRKKLEKRKRREKKNSNLSWFGFSRSTVITVFSLAERRTWTEPSLYWSCNTLVFKFTQLEGKLTKTLFCFYFKNAVLPKWRNGFLSKKVKVLKKKRLALKKKTVKRPPLWNILLMRLLKPHNVELFIHHKILICLVSSIEGEMHAAS